MRAQRKVVTVLFCDLVGFTRLGEGIDVEDLGTIANRLAALAAGSVWLQLSDEAGADADGGASDRNVQRRELGRDGTWG
jgi:hypothetical protein